MSLAEVIHATRSGAGLFPMPGRAQLEVRGADRLRWLDGMISGDVEALVVADSGAGCYATLLTNKGAIVADLHVGRLGEIFVLESRRDRMDKIRETLDRFIIADDVSLVDRSQDFETLALEGPRAAEVLSAATGITLELAAECWAEISLGGLPIRVAAFGFSGEDAFQISMAPADRPAAAAAIEAAGAAFGLVCGDSASLEVMRVEAGIPALGQELDEDVLPPEARLERAISVSKGCYVGQEIVARLRARGQVNHLLVGLRIESETLPPADALLMAEGRRTGEITSSVRSPAHGPIALGFVRREHSEVETRVDFEGGTARVAALPFLLQESPQNSPQAEPDERLDTSGVDDPERADPS